MKRLFALFTVLLAVSALMAQQVPQGFNYQAILRDASNNVIPNGELTVEISILNSSGSAVWTETHPVTTNQFGLVSLVVGQGTRTGGTATSFGEINWTAEQLKIKTTAIYNDVPIIMGTSDIWSVPYSLAASSLSGDVGKINIVEDVNSTEGESLFEVKNKEGQTIFAVYDEGVEIFVDDTEEAKGVKGSFSVKGFGNGKGDGSNYLFINGDSTRIYIDDDVTKGVKGGFAVGSFGGTASKATGEDYLLITRDSSRIYINDTNETGKGVKGSFAVQGFTGTKSGTANFFDISLDETSTIINPAKNRILWYPQRNAFLTGRVLIERVSDVGINSFASGYESRAKGNYSQAMGYKAYADGNNSTSIGQNSVALGANSYAIGYGALSNEISSVAIGEAAKAYGQESYAIGKGARANGIQSYAIGRGAIADGLGSFAFGSSGLDSLGNITDVVKAVGPFSIAIGQGATSTAEGSVAIGLNTTSSGKFSTAMGYLTSSSGYGSFTSGSMSVASGDYSIAMGYSSVASGKGSSAIGFRNYATDLGGLAIGYGNRSYATGAAALGTFSSALGNSSLAIGVHVNSYSYGETVLGMYNTVYTPIEVDYPGNAADRLLVVGNGAKGAPSDAMVIMKNGSVGIGTSTPPSDIKVSIESTSDGLFVKSSNTNANRSVYSYATGGTSAYAFYGTATGATTSNYGVRAAASGTATNNYGIYATASGATNNYAGYFNGLVAVDGDIRPTTNNNGNLGTSSYRWNTVYATNGVINTSDSRYKTNIKEIENSLDIVMKLNGVKYNWRDDEFPEMNFDSETHIGVLAQEVEAVLPELVFTDENGYKSVSYDKLAPVLIEAVKEQQGEIEALKEENQLLRERLEAIEAMFGL